MSGGGPPREEGQTPTVGVIVGVKREAFALAPLGDLSALRISVTGAKPGRAAIAAERLISEGVSGLVSYGTCGALDPALKPGAVLIPAHVSGSGGTHVVTDLAWREKVGAALGVSATGTEAVCLLSSDHVVTTAADKARLFSETGASAVDMESAEMAAAASAAGVPFIALRAVSDDAGTGLPPWISESIDDEGGEDYGALMRRIFSRPWDLPALFRLGRGSKAAFAALSRVAVRLGPLLGLPR